MIDIFENRYDIRYLETLLALLDFDHLKRSAVDIEREENYKPYKPLGGGPVKWLKRAIKIEFCGFAGTTLLGAASNELEKDIMAVSPEKCARIMQLRKNIREKFEDLTSKEKLKNLNEDGIFLQVRLCFSYLYADFPICMMRAEDSNIWDARMDGQVSFSKNAPLTIDEWEGSFLYNWQKDSLKTVGRLYNANRSLARIRAYDKVTNTLETRFAVIPVPVCLLIINDVAIADSYVYAKVTKENHLAFRSPINMADRSNSIYKLWRQNFLYIWRHDLTMYADMCTRFQPDNPAGLANMLPPIVPGTKKDPNIDWKKKIDRIIQRKKVLEKAQGRKYDPDEPEEKRRINLWLQRVMEKMELSTRKMREMPPEIDSTKLSIEIGTRALKYYIVMKHRDEEVFSMDKKTSSLGFCAMAHFAYAQKMGCRPTIHEQIHQEMREFKKAIIKWLESGQRIKNGKFTMQTLFKALFNNGQGRLWEFCIPPDQIAFKSVGSVSKATYKGLNGEKMPCFSGLPL